MNVNEIWTNATAEQKKWVIRRLQLPSDAAAARAVGIHPATACRWPNKNDLDALIAHLLTDTVETARLILAEAAPDAAHTLEFNLLGRKGVEAANSILDRVGLGRVSNQQHSGPEGQAIPVKHEFTVNDIAEAWSILDELGVLRPEAGDAGDAKAE